MNDLKYYKVKSLRKLGNTGAASKLITEMNEQRSEMEKNLVDNYAKFGASDKNVQQSNLKYFSGLIEELKGNSQAANSCFAEALRLDPGNIWAAFMSKGKTH